MNNLADEVFEQVRGLAGSEIREVLDFVGYLKSKHRASATAMEDEAADWAEFEKHAGAWSGKFNRDECHDRKILR
ncbi:MAG: hypothetical protein EOM92_02310 [Gammaproteobacteria bacterium]|jgi:hypothetical protein|nr:hypothetical protein [Gammaproteobacteria bacterium]